jgi:hypothetical protein
MNITADGFSTAIGKDNVENVDDMLSTDQDVADRVVPFTSIRNTDSDIVGDTVDDSQSLQLSTAHCIHLCVSVESCGFLSLHGRVLLN